MKFFLSNFKLKQKNLFILKPQNSGYSHSLTHSQQQWKQRDSPPIPITCIPTASYHNPAQIEVGQLPGKPIEDVILFCFVVSNLIVITGIPAERIQFHRLKCHGTRVSLHTTNFPSLDRSFFSKNRRLFVNNVLSNQEIVPPTRSDDDGEAIVSSPGAGSNLTTSQFKPRAYKNRFLNLVRLSSMLNDAAESFFKSEIRRRLFVTAVLIVMSRVGYFIPLPGFDRRLIPQDYMSFVSGSVGELHTYIHTYLLQSLPIIVHTNTSIHFCFLLLAKYEPLWCSLPA